MQIIGTAALRNKHCIVKQHAPVCCDCRSSTWSPVRVIFPTDAELKADPVPKPLPCCAWLSHPHLCQPLSCGGQPRPASCHQPTCSLKIPRLCSGFPLGLARGLSTKRRLPVICLETPLYSRGKYDRPSVGNATLCVVMEL